MSFNYGWIVDISDATKLLFLIDSRAKDKSKVLKIIAEELRDSTRRSFKEQKSPDDIPWEKSRLSQIDPTGSPRLTMIRSTNLYQDMQKDSNYRITGDSVEVHTEMRSDDNFLYGAYHNENKWRFAGMDHQGRERTLDRTREYFLQ